MAVIGDVPIHSVLLHDFRYSHHQNTPSSALLSEPYVTDITAVTLTFEKMRKSR